MSDVALGKSDAKPSLWRPLAANDRRVIGVLVEKAKTTPEAYPLSVNALRSGCNQKSNRWPLVQLEPEDVEESLARLRSLGAAVEVQGGGRVPRFRHCLYEWLGVDKVELAVMAELLLRGAQTEGELRGRAARMEQIADLAALRPILASLRSRGLVVALSPEGRGHVVAHALYEPGELETLRMEHSATASPARHDGDSANEAPRRTEQPAGGDWATRQSVDQMRREMDELRADLIRLHDELATLRSANH